MQVPAGRGERQQSTVYQAEMKFQDFVRAGLFECLAHGSVRLPEGRTPSHPEPAREVPCAGSLPAASLVGIPLACLQCGEPCEEALVHVQVHALPAPTDPFIQVAPIQGVRM